MKVVRPTLCAVAVVAASLVPVAASAQVPDPGCARSGVDDKCEAWVALFDDDEVAASASESPVDVAVAPDGKSVYSAVRTTVGTGFDGKSRWAILAYDTEGQRKWLARWGDPSNHSFPTSITVARDGSLVFVSGSWRVDQVAADGHLTTIALDPDTGDIVWQANYDGPAGGTDNARDLIVSSDNKTLYVAGISAGRSNADLDYAAIAYDSRTGAERWVTRWDGIGAGNTDSPFAIDVNGAGDMLYLTGWSYGEGEFNNDYGTIAVDTVGADAGRIAWTARYDGVGVHAPDQASALTVAPDDSTVFVTGMSDDVEGGPPFDVNYGYATVAYDAITGRQLWAARKQWPDTTFNSPTSMTIDPTGTRLVITGQAGSGQLDFGTVTYDPRTGAEAWSDRYGFQDYDLELGKELVIDPRGDTVYVTGVSAKSPPRVGGVVLHASNADQLSIAYDVMTGEKRWLARFSPAATDFVSVQSLAISPDATKIYTAAGIDDQNWDNDGDDVDAGLIAYEIGAGIPIPPPPTTIELTDTGDIRGEYSDETRIEARLRNSSGDPIAGATLDFNFQDGTASAITDEAGVATLTYTLTHTPGEHPLAVSFAGEEGNGPSAAEFVYTIEREAVRLTVEADRRGRAIKALLQDGDSGAGIEDRVVTFYFKGEEIGSARTDGSGTAVLQDPPRAALNPSGHLEAAFEGDAFYRAVRQP